MIKLIAAVDQSNAIGWEDGRLPWRIPEDMKRFKAATMGHDIVMGHKTFLTLPNGGLPGRRNIVLSRTKEPGVRSTNENSNIVVIPDWRWVQAHQEILGGEAPDVWIIGGAQVYKQALDLDIVDEMHLTLVNERSNADVRFPVDLSDIAIFCDKALDYGVKWSLVIQEQHLNASVPHSFIVLKRVRES